LRPDDPESIKQFTERGQNFEGATKFIEIITQFKLYLSILAASGAVSGPVLNMVKIFKLLYQLRLVNVFFGNILEGFLDSLDGGLSKNFILTDKDRLYMMKTRGKLTHYNVPVLSNKIIGTKFLFYFITKWIGLYEEMFKRSIKDVKKVPMSYVLIFKLINMIKTSIIFSTIYDVYFYGIREIAQHDLLIHQNASAKLSYTIVAVVFILINFDLVSIFWNLIELNVKKLRKIEKLDGIIHHKIQRELSY
jgi:hypothetical protein